MQISKLFTRKRHNEGIWIDVTDEAGAVVGKMRILGVDSDAFRSAHDAANREMVRLAAAVRAKADAPLLAATKLEKDEAKLAERAALVAEWSFEDSCTPTNVTALFREAPYLGDYVYFTACDRDRFLESNSPASIAGQNTTLEQENRPQLDPVTASPNQ
jgi:hypothetical protein